MNGGGEKEWRRICKNRGEMKREKKRGRGMKGKTRERIRGRE
jgi:hypothetical protein